MQTTDADVMKIHDELIVIDGAAPMVSWGMDPSGNIADSSGKGFDYYIEGGVTAAPATMSTTRLNMEITQKAVSFFDEIIEKRGFLKIRTAADLERAKREKKFGTWYHMQASYCVEDNLDALEGLKKAGVGQLQPTYNIQNRFANGCLERVNGGLSKAGLDLVKKCNELKIILDGSHQGDRDVLDMVEFSSSPVIVSHANARTIYKHPRNVPDDVIKAVAQNGGFVGVCGWPPFVSDSQFPSFDQLFAHLDHIVQLVGPDHASIGLDYFNMIQGVVPDEEVQKVYDIMISTGTWTVEEYGRPPYVFPTGIETPKKLPNLTGELLKRGYSKADVAKIWGGNWLRVMKQVWG
ncbi:dipeptidase [Petrachloros mirabilis]